MALKNLFDMVKADRYTADGREALIKAQEEETEDKVYNIGDISQKTGLMKTANGWVKPPRNKEIQNAGKHAESVKAAQKAKKEEARRQQRAEGEANARAFQKKVEKGEIKYNEETGKFEERKTTDSAPRVLTGDTRVRVRKA